MQMRIRLFTASLLAMGCFMAPVNADVIIDSFASGAITVQGTEYSTVDNAVLQTGLPSAETLGGTRLIRVDRISDDSDLTPATATIDPAEQQLRFENPSTGFAYLELIYGSEAPLGLDLTASNQDRFVVDISDASSVQRGVHRLQVVTGEGETFASDSVSITNQFIAISTSESSSGRISVSFTDFEGLDFGDVSSITLDFGRIESGQVFSIDRIAVVPEPASALLLSLGALTLCLRRRRRFPH